MKKTDSTIMDCYNKSVIQKIIDKYHFDPMTATRKFWQQYLYEKPYASKFFPKNPVRYHKTKTF